MQSSNAIRRAAVGNTVRAASRQVWLAGLGAAAVTRDWAGKEAGAVFRTLVREGTVVESRAMRLVGDRLDTSVTRAGALLRQARSGLEHAVKGYAGSAVALVERTLPRGLPKVALPRTDAATTGVAKRAKASKTQRATRGKRVKQLARRSATRATKR
jgi:Poly(hydroxyalcanoate) granule associated protein (phasin)